ncbi:hypothetical protein [Pseudomonas nitroreducens]|uniref:hypothetical protein n=1 Tax=Pseudomonas nitroreducens TaxID=46680 RepID=UPI00209CF2B3|nr:hypothetical protein [Pseudomonas nitroreducens]MCP1625325.1 hypothetical protein [Pseudomonas nitroreducens]
MNTQSKWLTAMLIPVCLLAGCKGSDQATAPRAAAATQQKLGTLDYPALPIIRNAVFSMSPLVDGKRNPAVMQQLCGLARGESTQAEVDRFVAASGESATSLKEKGGVTALLVNGNHAGQQIACAAYLATAPLIQVDGNEFIAPQKGADGKLQVDQARLSEVMAVRMALARTDAEYFGLIAEKLQQTPGLTDSQYQARTRELFSELAPAYLKRVKEMMPPPGTRFDLKQMDSERFAFSTSNGGEYQYTSDGMTLRQDNITWYGDGQLMGQPHTLKVAYYPETVTQVLGK